MNILNALKQLRDDIKAWVTINLNALDAKIDEKIIPVDDELDVTSENPVQNKVVTKAINNIPKFSGDYNDLINAPNITEEESKELFIADDKGNIILKANAEGIHTTAILITGNAVATEKYVDDAIANNVPDVDFDGYATEKFVTDAVNSAKEELSESIISESSEWKITDEAGNIIFSVDEEGAHTTELTLNGMSVREIAREEASKVKTTGMEYMGTTNTLPTGLTSADKGKTYLITSQKTINNLVIPIKQTFTTQDTWNTLDIDLNEYINLIPNSASVYINHEVLYDGGSPTAHEAMTLDLSFNFYDEWSETSVCYNGSSYQQSPGVCDGARFYIQDNDTTGFENETHGLSVYVDSIIIGDAPVNITDGNKINKGDLIIWTGSVWNVIPSGNDVLDTTELKNEIIQEMEDYVDNAILNGVW